MRGEELIERLTLDDETRCCGWEADEAPSWSDGDLDLRSCDDADWVLAICTAAVGFGIDLKSDVLRRLVVKFVAATEEDWVDGILFNTIWLLSRWPLFETEVDPFER